MAILTAILNALIVLTCLFLICLILIQRGKGGGLAGAFGGVGGSSAFGTKSGDVFTRVTIVAASVWIVLSLILVVMYNQPRTSAFDDGKSAGKSKEVSTKPGEKGKSATTNIPKPASGSSVPVPSGTSVPSASVPAPVTIPAIPDPPSPAKSK